MKRILLSLISLIWGIQLSAQSIPNPSFENWELDTLSVDPIGWASVNFVGELEGVHIPQYIQTSDAHSGNYAIRLDTWLIGDDTIATSCRGNGQTSNFFDITGFPFTSIPTTFSGWFKYDIPAGDTAYINISFRQGGSSLHNETFALTGTLGTYTELQFPIGNIPGTPDHVLIGFTSGKPGDGIPGGWVQVDDVRFLGPSAMDSLPNASFENWGALVTEEPVGWQTINKFNALGGGSSITPSFQSHTGWISLRMENVVVDLSGDTLSLLSSGDLFYGGPPSGGFSYSQRPNAFNFWYKYMPTNGDSAIGYVGFTRYNSLTQSRDSLGEWIFTLPPAYDWTYYELPTTISQDPDTALIAFSAGNIQNGPGQLGSRLFLDDLAFDEPIAIDPALNSPKRVRVFPNPASGRVTIDYQQWNSTVLEIVLLNANGKRVQQQVAQPYRTTLQIETLPAGVYFIRLVGEESILVEKLVVE